MRPHPAATPLNPALAVSSLLTRLGLFLLVVAAPLAAMASRRVVSVLIPIATALLILSAALEGRVPTALRRLGRLLLSPQALALMLLLIWAGISVFWTPRQSGASRFASVIIALLFYAAATVCIPERIRSSNANLIPIGVAMAVIFLAVESSPLLSFLRPGSPVAASPDRQRAAILLALLAWPALAVFAAKERWLQASAFALATLGALWLARERVALAAFLIAAVAFVLVSWRPKIGLLSIAAVSLALLVLAPLVGWWVAERGGFLLPAKGDRLVGIWRDVTFSLPTHLIRGYGFDASGALQRGPGGEILGSPHNAALQIWLELGLVGVALAGAALAAAWRALAKAEAVIQPAAAAVFISAAAMMFSGLAAWQSWWLTTLGLTAISLTFVSRWVRSRRSLRRVRPGREIAMSP